MSADHGYTNDVITRTAPIFERMSTVDPNADDAARLRHVKEDFGLYGPEIDDALRTYYDACGFAPVAGEPQGAPYAALMAVLCPPFPS